MKHLATLRYLLLVLLFATASACGDDEGKQADPAPTSHSVAIHYIGAGLNNLGARIAAGIIPPSGPSQSLLNIDPIPGAQVDVTTAASTVPTSSDFSVTVDFTTVKGTAKAPAGAYLKAEIIVDGKVRKTVQIDSTTPAGAAYVTGNATILSKEW